MHLAGRFKGLINEFQEFMSRRYVRGSLRFAQVVLSFETFCSSFLVLLRGPHEEYNVSILVLASISLFAFASSVIAVCKSAEKLERPNRWQKKAIAFDFGLGLAWIAIFTMLMVLAQQSAPWVDVFLNILLWMASAFADWATMVRSRQEGGADFARPSPKHKAGDDAGATEAKVRWTPAFRQAAELQDDIQRTELPASTIP
ncbi:hypothetical protein OHC33_003254 [Knufia fluminis]|uniref:Uncharacterized protein n=2 Tax=Knufia TaxID=430999 RepID=A0AAN8ENY7_9EURO|nr:hypothetical protein OHC33_003254 [Knufia fluminis]